MDMVLCMSRFEKLRWLMRNTLIQLAFPLFIAACAGNSIESMDHASSDDPQVERRFAVVRSGGWECTGHPYVSTDPIVCSRTGYFSSSTERANLTMTHRRRWPLYGLDLEFRLEHPETGETSIYRVVDNHYVFRRESHLGEVVVERDGAHSLSHYDYLDLEGWEFPDIVRDPKSGLDQLFLNFVSGAGGSKAASHSVVLSFETDGRLLGVEAPSPYSFPNPEYPLDGCDEVGLRSERVNQELSLGYQALEAAMSELLVGEEKAFGDLREWADLPYREVDRHMAVDALRKLTETRACNWLHVERARYATGADKEAWRVLTIQPLGPYCQIPPGAKLVWDRQSDRWYSIYDTEPDCRRLYSLDNMLVKEGFLSAWKCRTCGWDGNPPRGAFVYLKLGDLGRRNELRWWHGLTGPTRPRSSKTLEQVVEEAARGLVMPNGELGLGQLRSEVGLGGEGRTRSE